VVLAFVCLVVASCNADASTLIGQTLGTTTEDQIGESVSLFWQVDLLCIFGEVPLQGITTRDFFLSSGLSINCGDGTRTPLFTEVSPSEARQMITSRISEIRESLDDEARSDLDNVPETLSIEVMEITETYARVRVTNIELTAQFEMELARIEGVWLIQRVIV
jgi:hypothetical protein